jgi:hypothetical protein
VKLFNLEENPHLLKEDPKLADLVGGESAFLMDGEASPSPTAAWDVYLYFVWNRDNTAYALRVLDFGDTSETPTDEPIDDFLSIAAVDIEEEDEETIALELFSYFQKHSRRSIESVRSDDAWGIFEKW